MNIVSSGTSATKIPKIIEEGQGQSIFSGLDTGTNNSEVGSLVSGDWLYTLRVTIQYTK